MNRETEFKRSVKGQDVYCESSTEYVLPDYNSDVRKILFSEARVRPAGKFVGNDEVEFTGVVVYNVVYSDAEGKIGGTTFSSDYDFSVKASSENVDNVICDTRISNYALRLLSPRKLSAKCSVASALSITERMTYNPVGSAFDEGGRTEEQKFTLNVRNSLRSESVEREFAEELCRLEGAIEDEVRVVYCKAEIIPGSVGVEGDSAVIRGELVMTAIVENGETPAYLVQKKQNIEQSVPLEEVDEGMLVIPEAVVTSERVSIRADEDGCEIVMDVIAEFSVLTDANRSVETISDAFSTDYPVENTYRDIEYTELVGCFEAREKHTAQIARSNALEGQIREILYVSAEPKVESVQLEKNKAVVRGEIKYTGIASEINDDGTVSYSTLKTSCNFEENVNVSCQNIDLSRAEVKCGVVNSEANIDANSIYFSSDLETKVMLSEDKKQKALVESSINKDAPFEKNESVVTVYYPDEGETIFSIAKKFHVELGKLCENNSVAAAAVDGSDSVPVIKKLLIY